jgi:long-chain acyl-CoA synthetase
MSAVEPNMNIHPQQKVSTLSGWLANVGQVARTFAEKFKRTDASLQSPSSVAPEKTVLQWLKSYPPEVDWAAELPSKALYSLLEDAADLHHARPCVEFRGRQFSFAEIKLLSDKAAKGLADAGFKPGMKLGLFLPNCPYFVVFYYAGLKAGGIIVNYNPLYAEDEIARQIENSETDFMVTLDLAILLNKFSSMFERTKLRRIVVCSLAEQLSTVAGLLFRTVKWREIVSVPRNEHYVQGHRIFNNDGDFVPADIDPQNTIAVLQYTGGTTGVPKAATLTHANIYANAMQCKRWFYVADSPDNTSVGVLPLYHALAMTSIMNWSLAVGGSMLLEPRFEAAKLLSLIHRRKPSVLVGVPTLFTALMNVPNFESYDLSSLKFCISGGASLPLKVQQDFESKTGVSIWEGYGLSEASPACCINPVHVPNRSGSVGLPLPQTICEVVSIENRHQVLKLGEVGEICFRGPQIMQGYWKNPTATSEVIFDGRLHTGDIGYMDSDGYVFITDRLKEMITVSGYKVYPRQVEEAIYQHHAVKECAVFGVDDDYSGQSIRAAVCLRDGTALSAKELDAFLETRLSRLERPKVYDFRSEVPKTAIGKIYKKLLLEEYKLKAAASQETST